MKKYLPLPLIILLGIIILTALHRGGISFQAHLAWMVLLLPLLVFVYRDTKNKGQKIPSLVTGAILLFILSIIIGWSNSLMKDFGIISVTGLLSGVATLLIVIQMEITDTITHRFLKTLAIFTTLLAVLGIILYLGTPIDRLASTFTHLPFFTSSYPNAFALLILSILPYTLIEFGKIENIRSWNREKIALFSISTILISSLFLTFSRGAFIVFALIIVVLLLAKKIKLNKALASLAITTILLVTIIQIARPNSVPTNEFGKKLTLSAGEKSSSVSERRDFWEGALGMIKERPLTGFGPDTFRYAFPHYQKVPLANSDHPHNMMLKHAAEFGVPSTLLYLGIIFTALLLGWKFGRKNELTFSILIASSAIIAHNMIDFNLNFASTAAIFWTFLGLLISQSLEKISIKKSALTPKRIVICLSMLIVGVLFIGGMYEIYQRTKIVEARIAQQEKNYEKAETLLANSKPLFFEDAILLRVHNAINAKNEKLAHELLSNITKRNPIYAESFNLWSELFVKVGRLDNAQVTNYRALELDRYNRLAYHLQWIRIQQKIGKPLDQKTEKTYQEMLEDYLELLKNNAHNTVTTDDPSSAIQITHAIEEFTTNGARKIHMKSLRRKLTETAELERKKFTEKFHVTLEPLSL